MDKILEKLRSFVQFDFANSPYTSTLNLIFKIIAFIFGALVVYTYIYKVIGIFPQKKLPKAKKERRYGVIIPARNEEKVVANLIKSVRNCKYPQDKLTIFVIAHNCTDRTAEVSRNCGGAVVYEYNNPNECTMGYAFRHLFKCIEKDYGTQNFDGFFLFNADNILDDRFFEKMNDAFEYYGEKDIVTSCRNSKNFGSNAISGMYGIHFLSGCRFEQKSRSMCNCSTRIAGTGYVIPAELVKDGWNYVTLTEDWEFSSDQVLQGRKIRYYDEAMFFDEQPTSVKIMLRQRLRWAKGYLLVFKIKAGKLFKSLFSKKNKHKFSSYDMMMRIFPKSVVMFFVSIVHYLLLLLAPLFGEQLFGGKAFGDYAVGQLLGWGKSFLLGYFFSILFAVLMFILDGKRIPKFSFGKKVLMCLLWPIFGALNMAFNLVALFKKVEWKPIPHDDTTTHEGLNKAEPQDEKSEPVAENQ